MVVRYSVYCSLSKIWETPVSSLSVRAFNRASDASDGPFMPRFTSLGNEKSIQQRKHFLPYHRAALQQDLAHSQDLAVGECGLLLLHQTIPLMVPVVNDVLREILIGEKAAERLHVTLYASLGSTKTLAQFSFVEYIAAGQSGIDDQKPCRFCFAGQNDRILSLL